MITARKMWILNSYDQSSVNGQNVSSAEENKSSSCVDTSSGLPELTKLVSFSTVVSIPAQRVGLG